MIAPHRYYYLHNFQRALAWVDERYADVLSEEESGFLAQFAQLPMLSQALLVRMLMRRGPWFRASKLVYEEIADVAAAAQPLQALGWLQADADMALSELFDLHTKPELLALFSAHPGLRQLAKRDMLAVLEPEHAQARRYAQWHPQAQEPVWRVQIGPLCERLRLMFFGNLHQDWSEFVLADLGIFQYERVEFSAAARAFQSQADVDAYLALHGWRQALDEGAERAQLLASASARHYSNPWLEKRRAKLLLHIGQASERAQDWPLAEQAYLACAYPGARLRRIRVLERMQRIDDALALAQSAEQAPENDEESQRLARMLPRLQRSAGLGSSGRRTRLAPAVAQLCMQLELPAPSEPQAVEYVLRDHWNQVDAPVFYVENALINSLFGLLCWPAVFAPLPGAFFHPFQAGPADLSAPDFAERRASQFAECLALLENGAYRSVITERYASKQGLQSPFVFWGTLTPELLALALDCIPAQHLQLYFARLLRDVKAHRSGLPDLVRFWPAEKRYELVEVKAPGDQLQDNQIRWIEYCHQHQLPVRVCHVQWLAPAGQAPTA